ncbi:sodium:proton exchanger [Halobacteriales archaeon QS_1_69_70]|nr:MAG: sodium:proton exchanger [Halobacteriales archaeon QS_1_69_70]
MSQLNLWITAIGGLTLLLGLTMGFIRSRGYLPSAPMTAAAAGVLLGPYGVDVLRVSPLSEPLPLLEVLARFTVAFAVTSIALRLDPRYLRDRARSLAVLVGAGMVAMWLVSSLVAALALPVGLVVALLVGAVLTPTDPVLANSIVVGETATENIPERLRHLLSAEAGINDGVAYLFVFLPLLLLAHPVETALADWLTRTVLWEVLGAVALGAVVGTVAGRLERLESDRETLDETSVFTLTVALTFFVLGLAALAGTDDVLAVFVAAVVYNWLADPQAEEREQRVQEVFDRLFTIPAFVVFGMAIPRAGWTALGWRGPALVVGVLLLRRLPMVVAVRHFVPPLDRPAASLFVGWFGPIGIAAVFYAILAVERTGTELVWTATSLVVTGSIVVHGTTAVPATHRYADLGNES